MEFFPSDIVPDLFTSWYKHDVKVDIIKMDGSARVLEGRLQGSGQDWFVFEEERPRKIPLNRVMSLRVNGLLIQPKASYREIQRIVSSEFAFEN